MSSSFIKNQSGFTLIETLVSISIIALISGIFIANYRGAEKRSNLNLAAQKVASDIRFAQNYALGLQEFNGSSPPGGWGVYFTAASSQYIIFADTNAPDGNQNYDGASEMFRLLDLPDGITISLIDGASPASVSIVFDPPDPITWVYGADDNSVDITLTESVTGTAKTITVNFLGLIDVD